MRVNLHPHFLRYTHIQGSVSEVTALLWFKLNHMHFVPHQKMTPGCVYPHFYTQLSLSPEKSVLLLLCSQLVVALSFTGDCQSSIVR